MSSSRAFRKLEALLTVLELCHCESLGSCEHGGVDDDMCFLEGRVMVFASRGRPMFSISGKRAGCSVFFVCFVVAVFDGGYGVFEVLWLLVRDR